MVDRKVLISKLIGLNKENDESFRSFLSEYLTVTNERNLEPFTLAWYDPDVNEIDNIRQLQYELYRPINFIKRFNNPNECRAYIEGVKAEKIVVVMSNNHDHELLHYVHDQIQVVAIYIYCGDNNKATDWSKAFPKVEAVLADSTELVKTIAIDQTKREKLEDSTGICASFFNPNDRSTKSLEEENGDFMWFQLFIETLVRMSDAALRTSRNEFIQLIRQQYHDDVAKLRIVADLEFTYQSNQAIRWYSRDSFLHVILNKALRQQDYVLLFTLRFFIHDLFFTLIEQKKFDESSINLYRGQVVDIDELNNLVKNQGNFISMNSLLSTSRHRSTACFFAESAFDARNVRLRKVLFEIEVDTNRSDTKPFADIQQSTQFPEENEVLFMAGSVFRIINVQKISEDDPVWIIKLILCGEDDNRLNEVLANLRGDLQQETTMGSVGTLLYHMGKWEQSEAAFEVSNEHFRLEMPRMGELPETYTPGEDYPEMLRECQELVVKLTENNGDRNVLTYTYYAIGMIFKSFQQYDSAIENVSNALNVLLDLYGQDHLEIAVAHGLIGQIYEEQEKFQLAKISWKECLRIRQTLLPQLHPMIAETFGHIADSYNGMDDFDNALAMYEKALAIQLISLPTNHPSTAQIYECIAYVYEQTNEFRLALENYTIAFGIRQVSSPPGDSSLLQTQEDIDNMTRKLLAGSDN